MITTYTEDQLPRQLVQMYRDMSWGRPVPGYWWTNDANEWREHAQRGVDLWYANAHLMRDDWREEERAIIEKIIDWRSVEGAPGMFADEEDRIIMGADQATALRPYLEAHGRRVASWIAHAHSDDLRAVYERGRIPIDRNKGATTFAPGGYRPVGLGLSRLFHIGMSPAEYEKREGEISRWGVGRVCAVTKRVQGGRTLRWNWGERQRELVRLVQTVQAKLRGVNIPGFAMGWLEAPLFEAILLADEDLDRHFDPTRFDDDAYLKGCITLTGDVNICKQAYDAVADPDATYMTDEVDVNDDTGVVMAGDYTTFDDTLGYLLLIAWYEEVATRAIRAGVKRGLWPKSYEDLIVWIGTQLAGMDLLMPPLTRNTAARRLRHMGGLLSGQRGTSRIGSHCNDGIQGYATAESLRTHGRANVRILRAVVGDDHDLFGPAGIVHDIITKRGKLSHLLRTRSPAAVIKKKFLSTGRGVTPCMMLAGALSNSMSKEIQKTPRSLAKAASGIKSRRELLVGHPAAHVFDEWCAGNAKRYWKWRVAYNMSFLTFAELSAMMPVVDVDAASEWDDDGMAWEYLKERRFSEMWDLSGGLPREPTLSALMQAASKISESDAIRIINNIP